MQRLLESRLIFTRQTIFLKLELMTWFMNIHQNQLAKNMTWCMRNMFLPKTDGGM